MTNSIVYRFAAYVCYMLFGSMLLYLSSPLLIPLSYGLLIAFVLYPVSVWLERKRIPRVFAAFISILLVVILVILIMTLLFYQLRSFFEDWNLLKSQIIKSIEQLFEFIMYRFNVPREIIDSTIHEQLKLGTGRLFSGLGTSVVQLGSGLVTIFIIPVFAFLFLTTRNKLLISFKLLFKDVSEEQIRSMLNKVIQTYYRFIKGMILVYLIVAALNSIGLLILGVPHAILFGCIASILTFIPYVGIMVGALLPISVSWITYGSIWYPVGVIAIFAFVQYLEANIIFPYAVGTRLNLNTLVTLMAIFLGGIIWGVSGMILFVPFLAIIKLLADQKMEWNGLANMLSDK